MIPGHYLPVFLFLLAALTFGVLSLVLGRVLAPHKPDPEKNAIYECGFSPFEKVHKKFDVRFYLIAILFILFDVETAFLFPWGAAAQNLGWEAFVVAMVFLAELLAGFIYIWKKGALDWE